MKNADLFEIKQKWNKLGSLTGFTFLMELRRNKKLIENEIEVLESIREETPEYKKFREEYLKNREQFADLDGNGKPIMVQVPNSPGNQTYRVTEKQKEWDEWEKNFLKQQAKVLEVMESKNNDFNEALQQECTVDFYLVTEKSLPKNITNEQLDIVEFMIDFEDDDKAEIPEKKKMKVKK